MTRGSTRLSHSVVARTRTMSLQKRILRLSTCAVACVTLIAAGPIDQSIIPIEPASEISETFRTTAIDYIGPMTLTSITDGKLEAIAKISAAVLDNTGQTDFHTTAIDYVGPLTLTTIPEKIDKTPEKTPEGLESKEEAVPHDYRVKKRIRRNAFGYKKCPQGYKRVGKACLSCEKLDIKC